MITKSGAVLNVSGGTLQYQQGLDRTTTLLGSDGRIYNIANAPIDITYVGFADGYTVASEKWGTTTIFATPRPVLQGYTEGKSAGTVSISTPRAVLLGCAAGVRDCGGIATSKSRFAKGWHARAW